VPSQARMDRHVRQPDLLGAVGDEPAGELAAPGVDAGDRVAEPELSAHLDDPGGEQALAALDEGAGGPLVDHELAARPEREGEPVLAAREPRARGVGDDDVRNVLVPPCSAERFLEGRAIFEVNRRMNRERRQLRERVGLVSDERDRLVFEFLREVDGDRCGDDEDQCAHRESNARAERERLHGVTARTLTSSPVGVPASM